MTRALLLRLFVPYALGNLLSAFHRNVTAIVAPDLIDTLRLSAEDIGFLTSLFFLMFAAAQLPLGVLLDQYGARRVTAVLFLVAAAGSAIFGSADDMATLALGRALMGLGVAVALMGGFKALVEWLPRERLPFGNSILFVAVGLGTMSSTTPVHWALGFTDWRGVFFILAGISVAIAVVLFVTAPDKPRSQPPPALAEAGKGMLRVLFDANFLRCAPLGGIAMGVAMSMSALWAGPWLADVNGLPRSEVAEVLFAMAATTVISALLTGAVVERLARAGVPILTTACIGIAGVMAFQVLVALDVPASPYALWLPMSFFGATPILIYTVLMDGFPRQFGGRVNTAYNFVTFAAAFAAQWGMGAIIDLFPHVAEGAFAPIGYRTALAAMVAVEALAFLWLLLAPRGDMVAKAR